MITLTLSFSCKSAQKPDFDVISKCEAVPLEQIKTVPLIRLIANPSPYQGKCVATSGFISFRFEDHNIYLSLSDYKNVNTDNSASILIPDISDANYDEGYYKDHEGLLIGVVENQTDSSIEKTVIHLYKTHLQALNTSLGAF